MRRLVVIDVVGLTPDLVGEHTPNIQRLAAEGFQAELGGVFPAVTCTAQATMLTGKLACDHGIVSNGWYFRDLAEVLFWRQANSLVTAPKVWERARERVAGFSCAKLFWWFNMYSSADWSVTPRPHYPADGSKVFDIYTQPQSLRGELHRQLGPFPFFQFWGPKAGIDSSQWISRAAQHVLSRHQPDLTLVYLPHLDYDFQRFGPDFPERESALRAVDAVAGHIIQTARSLDREVVVLSEYGITPVRDSVSINRVLRREGLVAVRPSLGWELLDAGASRAFAVSDHQVAHVYIQDKRNVSLVRSLLEGLDGVESVLDDEGKRAVGIDHPRSGELVAVAAKDRWFDYYWWLDDACAPDFAPTVDIHRKPGYDPLELFLDPEKRWIKPKILWKLLLKKLGFRYRWT